MLQHFFRRNVLGNPRRKRYFWKWFYQFVSARYGNSDWTYMNYGYVPHGYERPSNCTNPDWAQTMLYSQLIGDIDLCGLDLLEVGSGRGGGTQYIHESFKPKSIVGLDISEENVKHSRQFHKGEGLHFEIGDAENIPYADHSFDAVINVESSHCYGSRVNFYQEVHRVLRPGGVFLLTDLYPRTATHTLVQELTLPGFELVTEDEITQNVLRSLDLGRKEMVQKVAATLPRSMKRHFEAFAGYPNTVVYESLKSGESAYLRHSLRKASSETATASSVP